MAKKTVIISVAVIDEETGKQDGISTVESNDLNSVQVCDIQDLVMTGVMDPLRKIAREKAVAKLSQGPV